MKNILIILCCLFLFSCTHKLTIKKQKAEKRIENCKEFVEKTLLLHPNIDDPFIEKATYTVVVDTFYSTTPIDIEPYVNTIYDTITLIEVPDTCKGFKEKVLEIVINPKIKDTSYIKQDSFLININDKKYYLNIENTIGYKDNKAYSKISIVNDKFSVVLNERDHKTEKKTSILYLIILCFMSFSIGYFVCRFTR